MKPDDGGLTYEVPTVIVLGDVSELTLGGGGSFDADASATYVGDSDARLKRRVRTINDALSRLRESG